MDIAVEPSQRTPVVGNPSIPITQLLFDCDNTLVLSEVIAFNVCAVLINELLSEKVPFSTTRYSGRSLQSEFVGQNFAGMLSQIEAIYGFKLTPEEREGYINREVTTITKELGEKAEPCEGANEKLKQLKEEGRHQLAVVSSSAKPRVLAALKKAGQIEFFSEDHVYSAMTSLPTPTSKPDPAIYRFACLKLVKDPLECIAVEDSSSGVKSAVAAGIRTIGYVGAYEPQEREAKSKKLQENGASVCIESWGQLDDAIGIVAGIRVS